MALTNRQIIQKPDITIDPVFPVPVDVVDVKIKEKTDQKQQTDAEEDNGTDLGTGDDITRPKLSPPDTMWIINQTVKIGKGGAVTVDVLVGFPNQDGVESYESRVAKA